MSTLCPGCGNPLAPGEATCPTCQTPSPAALAATGPQAPTAQPPANQAPPALAVAAAGGGAVAVLDADPPDTTSGNAILFIALMTSFVPFIGGPIATCCGACGIYFGGNRLFGGACIALGLANIAVTIWMLLVLTSGAMMSWL